MYGVEPAPIENFGHCYWNETIYYFTRPPPQLDNDKNWTEKKNPNDMLTQCAASLFPLHQKACLSISCVNFDSFIEHSWTHDARPKLTKYRDTVWARARKTETEGEKKSRQQANKQSKIERRKMWPKVEFSHKYRLTEQKLDVHYTCIFMSL